MFFLFYRRIVLVGLKNGILVFFHISQLEKGYAVADTFLILTILFFSLHDSSDIPVLIRNQEYVNKTLKDNSLIFSNLLDHTNNF